MRHVFCNIPLKAFLECQMPKDESTPLAAIKTYSFDAAGS